MMSGGGSDRDGERSLAVQPEGTIEPPQELRGEHQGSTERRIMAWVLETGKFQGREPPAAGRTIDCFMSAQSTFLGGDP